MVLTVMPILITSDILVWPMLLAQELPSPQQNLIFWNLFEFSAAEITQKSISPTF
jgi:hypothetical protein